MRNVGLYTDLQKSASVELARLLPYVTVTCCFDSHPRIDSILQKSQYRYGLLENAIRAAEAGTQLVHETAFGWAAHWLSGVLPREARQNLAYASFAALP